MRRVPVANVYHMLLYAWRLIGDREPVDATPEGSTELHDLFAHVLADTISELVARGLDRGYVEREEAVRGVRGRPDLPESIKRNLLVAGQVHCRFDEMEYDVLHNRILKATLRKLLNSGLHEQNRDRVLRLHQKLDAVADVRIEAHDFRRVQLHRNNAPYEYALRLCELIHDNLMVDERSGRIRYREYRESEQKMGRLFEKFVGAFFERHHPGFRKQRVRNIPWLGSAADPSDWNKLPRMIPDVVLENAQRRIIIETKFYSRSFGGSGVRQTVISDHLYQLLAYVQNRAAQMSDPEYEGILLYPVVTHPFARTYTLLGHRLAVRSIDLRQPWSNIRHDLLAVLD